MIERAGGEDVFGALRSRGRAPDRVVTPEQVLAAQPEIIFASWCGKPVSVAAMAARPGWAELPAVQTGCVHALAGAHILQPGYGLTRGYAKIKRHLESWDTRFGSACRA